MTASSTAWGQSSAYRLQLVRTEGAASCPPASVIEGDVAQRLGRSPFAQHGERGIEVVIERTEDKWRAKLYLHVDESEADAMRLIESDAPDCSELRKAVALAVALAIAPELPPEPKPEPRPKPPPPPICEAPRASPPAPLLARSTLHGEGSLRGLISPNLLPSSSAGVALAITVRGSLIGAAFGGVFFPENELRSADARLGFGLTAGFVSGCLWAKVTDPQVWSCLGSRFGVLHTVVYEPQPDRPGDRTWLAASSELGLRQHFLERLFIEGGVAAVFPLLRHRFQVDASSTPVYEQGPAVAEGFVGFGLELD